MIDRRDLLKIGIGTPLAFALPGTAIAAGTHVDALVVDRRLGLAAADLPQSAPVHWIEGDVTAFWYGHLDARWRQPGFVLSGITRPDALFVLETLAWDRGRRVVHRGVLDGEARETAVVWTIAPAHPSVRS